MLKHVSSTTDYPQGNGEAKSTNKVISRLLTKLVNEKKNWDEHLFTILFSYKIVHKVAIIYITYQLVYGLHLQMPTKYVLLAINGDHKDAKPARVLTTRIIEVEKLQDNRLEVQNNVRANQWSIFLWSR